jgi:hypothetical protein
MSVKDYYKMLEVAPGATEYDIKKSFRRLALRYHPDTNQGNAYSAAWFRELQEAYDTLTDPAKKEYYLQQRWLAQSQGKRLQEPAPLTPDALLAEVQQLQQQVQQLDHFRMDHQQLLQQLLQPLSHEKLSMMDSFGDAKVAAACLQPLLEAAQLLPYPLARQLYPGLQRLALGQQSLLQQLQLQHRRQQRQYWWSRHQWWVMLLATILLCSAIFWLG